ncbi:glycosyltransferase [Aeromonas media]|uniref:glycosyltransferase n=1 Tax=Aeromonas media TaxID=651 RepID=UPI00370A3150
MDNTVLTVCIVTYNQKKYIKQCLESIVNQKTNYSYKVIISDDASTDGTSEICAEYAAKYSFVKHIRHEVNIGPSENFKYAHRRTKTKYVSHCDGDDYWAEDKVEVQIDFLEKNIDCSAVYSNAIVVNEDDSVFGCFNNVERIPDKINTAFLLEKFNFLNNSSMTYRVSDIGAVFSVTELIVDYHVHIILSRRGFLGYIKTPLAFYRKGADGSQCLIIPTLVGNLVHKARLDGIKQSKLSVKESSKIKANAWYGKTTALLRKNSFAYNRHGEVEILVSNYSFTLALKYLLLDFFILALDKVKDKSTARKVNVFCRR